MKFEVMDTKQNQNFVMMETQAMVMAAIAAVLLWNLAGHVVVAPQLRKTLVLPFVETERNLDLKHVMTLTQAMVMAAIAAVLLWNLAGHVVVAPQLRKTLVLPFVETERNLDSNDGCKGDCTAVEIGWTCSGGNTSTFDICSSI